MIVGGSSSCDDTVYAIEMLCTDDSVRPRAWVRVRSVADDQPGEHGMAHAASQLAGRIHVRSHAAEGTDPGPATEAIRSRLLSATHERIELEIESTRAARYSSYVPQVAERLRANFGPRRDCPSRRGERRQSHPSVR